MKKLFLMAAVLTAFNGTIAAASEPWTNTATGATYAELSEAVTAATAGDKILLTEAATITKSVTVDKKITVDLGSYTATSTVAETNTTGNTFLVKNGGNLTLQNGYLVGQWELASKFYGISKTNYEAITSHSRAIEGQSGSTVTLNSVRIGNFATTKGNGAAVCTSGTLTATSCYFGYASTWQGNLSRNGGAIYAADGADVTINTCNIWSNISCDNTANANNYNHGGGALYIGSNTTAKIVNNSFCYNSCYGYGGVIHLDQAKDVNISEDNWFLYNKCSGNFTMDSSDKGYGGAGGVIYSRISTKVVIKDNSKMQGYSVLNQGDRTGGVIQILTVAGCEAEISGNEIYDGYAASYGGGIYLKISGGKVTLSDNHIYHNRATRGGGIFIQNTGGTLSIPSGVIENNAASTSGGGIDYTTHKQQPLYLTNVLLTGNMAARGGAYWGCPASETTMYTTQGAAIYGNTTLGTASGNPDGSKLEASGDDVRYEAEGTPDKWSLINSASDDPFTLLAPTETTQLTLSSRLLGGASAAWYQDEAEDRYASGDTVLEKSAYTKTRQSIGIHSEASDQAKTLADSEAKLIIRDNVVNYYYKGFDTQYNGKYDESSTRGRGGGIATNSPVIIGLDEDVSVKVTKAWSRNLTASDTAKVYVTLYRVDANGAEVKLDENVELEKAASGNLEAVFTDLPASYLDADGNTQKYAYTIKETEIDGWFWKTETAYDSGSRTYNITLTNTEAVTLDYVTNGGSAIVPDITDPQGDNKETYEIGTLVKLNDGDKAKGTTRDSFVFMGWYLDKELKTYIENQEIKMTGDKTVYAGWGVYVTFDPNGGAMEKPAGDNVINNGDGTYSVLAKEGGLVTEPADPKTDSDYAFDGWYTEASGGSKWDFSTDIVTRQMTLYAQWAPIDDTVFVQRYVHIPAVDGVTTDPAAGYHYVFGHDDFTFTAVFADGEPQKVFAAGYYSGDTIEIEPTINADGAYEYTLRQVTEPWMITFGSASNAGETGTEAVAETRVWVHGNTLHISAASDTEAAVYTLSGSLIKTLRLTAGEATETLERGVYVVNVGGKTAKVVIR